MKVGKRKVETKNENKVFFPESNITKGEIIEYYHRISDVMLPYLKNRPVVMHRFPNGINEENFFQKEAPDYFPKWMDRIEVSEKDGSARSYIAVNNASSLVYLANQACITPHVWLSKNGRLNNPDKLVVDLDPPDGNFELVKTGALMLKDKFEEIGWESFALLTGSEGIHVIVPLDGESTFDSVREFVRLLAKEMVSDLPAKFTLSQDLDERKGKLYIDYVRNSYGQTTVAPYAVRARPYAPVATPVSWGEVAAPDISPRKYNIKNIFRRLSQKEDPWKNIGKLGYSLRAKNTHT